MYLRNEVGHCNLSFATAVVFLQAYDKICFRLSW